MMRFRDKGSSVPWKAGAILALSNQSTTLKGPLYTLNHFHRSIPSVDDLLQD